MWWHDGGGAGGWALMVLMMLAVWTLVAFCVWALVRGSAEPKRTPADQPRRDPLRILDERFARGEIDTDEYQARRGILEAHR